MTLTYQRSFGQGLLGKYAKVASTLPPKTSVLEIGSNTGYFTRVLMDDGYQVLGIEKDEEAARTATSEGIPVICGDIEDAAVLSLIRKRFDAVLLMDVLEHLKDPTDVLKRLRSVLNENGRVVITGPNIAYWAVRKDLLLGRWEYVDAGILDRTHLHFYAASGWRSLICDAGYKITNFEPAEGMIPLEKIFRNFGVASATIDRLRKVAMRVAPTLFATVYFIEARSQ